MNSKQFAVVHNKIEAKMIKMNSMMTDLENEYNTDNDEDELKQKHLVFHY